MRFGNPSKKSRTLVSLKGHSIEFIGRVSLKDGKPPADYVPPTGSAMDSDGITYVYVPPAVRNEAISFGLQSETEMADEVETSKPVKPEDPAKLKDAAFEVFKMLTELGQREDFSGNGQPKPAAIEKLLGYPLVSSEIKELWTAFQIATKG